MFPILIFSFITLVITRNEPYLELLHTCYVMHCILFHHFQELEMCNVY